MCVDPSKFGKLLEDNENAYLTGVDQFPRYVNDAYHHVTSWSNDPRNFKILLDQQMMVYTLHKQLRLKSTGTKTPLDPTTIQSSSSRKWVTSPMNVPTTGHQQQMQQLHQTRQP